MSLGQLVWFLLGAKRHSELVIIFIDVFVATRLHGQRPLTIIWLLGFSFPFRVKRSWELAEHMDGQRVYDVFMCVCTCVLPALCGDCARVREALAENGKAYNCWPTRNRYIADHFYHSLRSFVASGRSIGLYFRSLDEGEFSVHSKNHSIGLNA